MRPYTIDKDAIGTERRVPWPPTQSNAVFQQIRSNLIRKLSERDCAEARRQGYEDQVVFAQNRGHEVLSTVLINDGDEAGRQVGDVKVTNKNQAVSVHEGAKAIKHCSRELADLQQAAWAKFCSAPRSYDAVEIEEPYVPKFAAKVPGANGAAVVATGVDASSIDPLSALPSDIPPMAPTATTATSAPTAPSVEGFVPFKCPDVPGGRPVVAEKVLPERVPVPASDVESVENVGPSKPGPEVRSLTKIKERAPATRRRGPRAGRRPGRPLGSKNRPKE